MADIASLGIVVTTQGVQQAQGDLDKLAASGDAAAKSTDTLNKSFSQGIGNSARQASVAYNEQTAALAKLAAQIDPTIAAYDRLDKQQAKLADFKKSGLIGEDDFARFSTAIDAARVKVGTAGEAMHTFSLNSALARREMGRLVTDVANGNWGRFEQTAMTLANYSGVMSVAFSGIGVAIGAVVGALALWAVAALKGYNEQEQLRTSLIATGGAAGTSAAALDSLASSIGKSTGEWGNARAAVEAFTASGKVAGAGLSGLSETAVNVALVTGQNIDKVTQSLIDLSEKPADTIAKLNAQYNFLTAAQYAQIAALEAQGKTQDAANIAEQTYAAAFADRAKQVQDQSGWIVNAAHDVAQAWDKAWNSLKGAGKTPGLQDQINALQEQKDQLTGGQIAPNGVWQAGASNSDPRVQQLQTQIDALRAQQVNGAISDNAKQLAATANAQSIAAQKTLSQYASPEDKLNSALAKANEDHLAALYGIVDPATKAKIEEEYTNQIEAAQNAYDAATNKMYGKPKAPKPDPMAPLNSLGNKVYNDYSAAQLSAGGDDNAQVSLYKQEVSLLQQIADAGGKAISKGADLAAVQAKVADLTGKTTAAFALESQTLTAKNVAALKAYQDAIDQQIAAKQRQLDLQVASVGMGDKEAQQMEAIAAIYEKTDSTIEQLQRQRTQKGADTQLIDGQIAAQKNALPVLVKQQQDAYTQMDAAQSSWVKGFTKAYNNYEDQAQNVAGLSASFFTSAFDDMSDALATFATTGKLNFNGLVVSILSDLAKMEAKVATSDLLQMLLGSFAGGMGSSIVSSSTVSGWQSSSIASDIAVNAKGGVYDSPSLSAYSGSVVSTPTMFAFANGAGLMGEAGPEAILPLRRGSDGKLGIAGGGGGGDMNYSQTINIDNSGNASQTASSSQSSALAQQFGDRMKQQARQTIAEEQRPGGLLWRMAHA